MGDCWAPEPTCKRTPCPEGKTCCEGYNTWSIGHVECCDSDRPVCNTDGKCIPTPPPCSKGHPGDCDTVGKKTCQHIDGSCYCCNIDQDCNPNRTEQPYCKASSIFI